MISAMTVSVRSLRLLLLVSLFGPFVLLGCDQGGDPFAGNEDGSDAEEGLSNCTIQSEEIVSGCNGKDCIPALTNPTLTDRNTEAAGYLAPDDRVIGLLFGDQALAIPHNILWFHEIVNLDDWAGRTFAVTYCPLTGSSLAFDRGAVDGAEFGVSGLLFQNNLIMYDRQRGESFWPQMNRQANCGTEAGTALEMEPVIEMTWAQWQSLHPDTKVISENTPQQFNYSNSNYPYGNYEEPNNDRLLFDMPINDRRPPKERVLGIPNSNDGGVAFPFGELDDGGTTHVVERTVQGASLVVFWHRAAQGAMAYRATVDGQQLSFSAAAQDGRFVDEQTGSTWTLDGRAVSGPKAGTRLEPVDRAYVAFWFAWAAFQPQTIIWTNDT